VSDIGFLVRELIDAGTLPEVAAEMIARAFVAGTQAAHVRGKSVGAERQARYRERNAERNERNERNESVTSVTPPSLNDTPELLSKPSESNLNPPPFTPPPLARGRVVRLPRKPEYPPEFQMLWDVFPKHPNASKSEALRRWEQLDPGDRDNCLTGAMRYEDFLAAERRKRPDYPGLHLATFVHQRRWEAHLEAAE
jgi:hypothetical protein